jgi:hypothetical protein
MSDEKLQVTENKDLDFNALAQAWCAYLDVPLAERKCTAMEWATQAVLPARVLRRLQRWELVKWLRIEPTFRVPHTARDFAAHIGVNEHTVGIWRDEPEIHIQSATGALRAVQEHLPKAVRKLGDLLDSPMDSFSAVKLTLEKGMSDPLKPANQVTINNNNFTKIDGQLAQMKMACGHTIAVHGITDKCDSDKAVVPDFGNEL